MRTYAAIAIVGVLVAGCETTGGGPPPSSAPLSADAVKALTDVEAVQAEVRELRNLIEEQQYELSQLQDRQRALYDDLDRRLRLRERAAGGAPALDEVARMPGYAGEPAAAADLRPPAPPSLPPPAVTPPPALPSSPPPAVTPPPALPSSPPPAAALPPVAAGGLPQEGTAPGVGVETETVSSVAPRESRLGDVAGEQAAYDAAFDLLKAGRYQEAVAGFERLLVAYPDSELADDAQYWVAEAYYVTRNFASALDGYRAIINRYPGSQRIPEAMLKIGYLQYEMGAYDRARATLNDILSRFPGTPVALSADTRLQKMDREGR